jgi:predicted AAA+ superfamily ATPase
MDGEKEVLLIRGPRQSGKTTCLLHLRDMHGGSYVTLGDVDALRTFDESPKEFASRYLDRGGILYLDEIQYSKNLSKPEANL